MTKTTKQLIPVRRQPADLYISANGAFVLTVLENGTLIRLPRECYGGLVQAKPKPWSAKVMPVLYWLLRLALLGLSWHGHR